MSDIKKLLLIKKQQKFATDTGTKKHKMLQKIIIDNGTERGDAELINKIKSDPEILKFFGKDAKTEVPVAGTINNKFISRRIDRMIVNYETKTVRFIDYKTDTDTKTNREKYKFQMNEYAQLLRQIYPDYYVSGHILWLCDWTIEKII